MGEAEPSKGGSGLGGGSRKPERASLWVGPEQGAGPPQALRVACEGTWKTIPDPGGEGVVQRNRLGDRE